MKNLFCKRLASCLYMKQPEAATLQPPPLAYTNVWNADVGQTKERQRYYLTTSYSEATNNDDTNTLLKKICHLLETRARRNEQQRYVQDMQRYLADKEDQMKTTGCWQLPYSTASVPSLSPSSSSWELLYCLFCSPSTPGLKL